MVVNGGECLGPMVVNGAFFLILGNERSTQQFHSGKVLVTNFGELVGCGFLCCSSRPPFITSCVPSGLGPYQRNAGKVTHQWVTFPVCHFAGVSLSQNDFHWSGHLILKVTPLGGGHFCEGFGGHVGGHLSGVTWGSLGGHFYI